MKEYKVGEVFECEGKWYECEPFTNCGNCGFGSSITGKFCKKGSHRPACQYPDRRDYLSVGFKLLSPTMTRPIGSTFIYDGEEVEVCETAFGANCGNCFCTLHSDVDCESRLNWAGACSAAYRLDNKNVYFKKKGVAMKKLTLENLAREACAEELGRFVKKLVERKIDLGGAIDKKIALEVEKDLGYEGWLKEHGFMTVEKKHFYLRKMNDVIIVVGSDMYPALFAVGEKPTSDTGLIGPFEIEV